MSSATLERPNTDIQFRDERSQVPIISTEGTARRNIYAPSLEVTLSEYPMSGYINWLAYPS